MNKKFSFEDSRRQSNPPDNVFQRANPTLLTYLIPGKARILAVFDEKMKNADYYPNTSANVSKKIEKNKIFEVLYSEFFRERFDILWPYKDV